MTIQTEVCSCGGGVLEHTTLGTRVRPHAFNCPLYTPALPAVAWFCSFCRDKVLANLGDKCFNCGRLREASAGRQSMLRDVCEEIRQTFRHWTPAELADWLEKRFGV